ncbi:MAG: pyridoxal-dependent decarboxylase [Actinomycetota bacterium]
MAGYHMDAEEFRRNGYAMIDWITSYLQRVETLPVLSSVQPGETRAQLPASPPAKPETFEAMMQDVERIVLPGITHWQSPSFHAYFPANSSEPSILGELLSAGLSVQGMLWATSPACTEIETLVLDWLVELLGLPDRFLSSGEGGGVIQDTASSSALVALVAARERATNGASNRIGVRERLTVYASSQAHSSIEKAVRIAGIGSDGLRPIDVDDALRMNPHLLESAIERDIAEGCVPVAIVATVGTTSTLAIDPVREIARIAQRFGIWLHVDAAMAGTAALLPEQRHIHDGVELADSYCFNPHKWMFTNFDCNAFYVADRSSLTSALSILPEYLRNAPTESGAVIDYRDWQIPLGRRFRALKLWFVIRHYGSAGLRHLVSEHLTLTRTLEERIRASAQFEIVAPPSLNLLCFAHREGDEATQRVMDTVNKSGEIYVTHTRVHGRLAIRFCIGGTRTEQRHIDKAWRALTSAGAR